MVESMDKEARVKEVRRIFEDLGIAVFDALENWDGDDLNDLKQFLTDEEFETLLDSLGEEV